MEFFDMAKRDTKIVSFRTDFKEKGTFTKTCSDATPHFFESNRTFTGDNKNGDELIENFKNGIKLLAL